MQGEFVECQITITVSCLVVYRVTQDTVSVILMQRTSELSTNVCAIRRLQIFENKNNLPLASFFFKSDDVILNRNKIVYKISINPMITPDISDVSCCY